MTLLRGASLVLVMFGLMLSFAMIDVVFHLGLTAESSMEIFVAPFIMIVSVILIYPKLRNDFFQRFILNKENFHQAVCYPILAAIGLTFLINLLRFIPYWMGKGELIGIGSNQVTAIPELTQSGYMVGAVIMGPFTEEFIFRYLLYGGVLLLLQSSIVHSKILQNFEYHLYINRTGKYVWSWILISNVIFAAFHGPNLLNFWIYLIPGMVAAWFFIKYGFLSSWISHSMFNLFSGMALQILLVLLT